MRAPVRTFAQVVFSAQLLLLAFAGEAKGDLELRAGVRHLASSHGPRASDATTTVVDVEIAKAGPRHRFSLDLAGLSTRGSDEQLQLFLGRVRAAVRRGRPLPRGRVEKIRSELEPRRIEGLADALAGWSAVFFGGDARQLTLLSVLEAKIPLADESEGLGTGEWDFRAGVFAERRYWSTTLTAEIGINHFGDPPDIDLRDVFDLSLGLEGRESRHGLVFGGWLDAADEIVAGAGTHVAAGLSLARRRSVPWRLEIGVGLTEASEDLSIAFRVGTSGWSRRP